MKLLKKYCIYLSIFLHPLLISAEPGVKMKENATLTNLDVKVADFFLFVKDLQKQGLFDGEILVAQNDRILLNLRSENIPSFDG